MKAKKNEDARRGRKINHRFRKETRFTSHGNYIQSIIS